MSNLDIAEAIISKAQQAEGQGPHRRFPAPVDQCVYRGHRQAALKVVRHLDNRIAHGVYMRCLQVVDDLALGPVHLPRGDVERYGKRGFVPRFAAQVYPHSRDFFRQAYSQPTTRMPMKTTISSRTNTPNSLDKSPKLAAQGNRKTTSTSNITKIRANP